MQKDLIRQLSSHSQPSNTALVESVHARASKQAPVGTNAAGWNGQTSKTICWPRFRAGVSLVATCVNEDDVGVFTSTLVVDGGASLQPSFLIVAVIINCDPTNCRSPTLVTTRFAQPLMRSNAYRAGASRA